MNIYQLTWGIKLLEGLLIFKEGKRIVGEMKLSNLFGSSYYVEFKSSKYIVHPEILGKSLFRIYNSANERQLAVVKIKFWSSESRMEYQGKEYQLKSNALGIFNAYWTYKEERRYMSFSNQIFSGSVLESVPDEEMYHLFAIAAIQSMFIYSLLLLFVVVLTLYVIF